LSGLAVSGVLARTARNLPQGFDATLKGLVKETTPPLKTLIASE
jgi:hypothetical protein